MKPDFLRKDNAVEGLLLIAFWFCLVIVVGLSPWWAPALLAKVLGIP
jgi:hypothetical protein